MTSSQYEIRLVGRPIHRGRDTFGARRIVDVAEGGPAGLERMVLIGWTPAHSEVARFLGGCFAAGALLGLATEMARPIWRQHHG